MQTDDRGAQRALGIGGRRERRGRLQLVRRADAPSRASSPRAPLAMVAPFFLLFIIFFVGPLVYSVVDSFRSSVTGAFVGVLNYRYVFGLGVFWAGVARVLYFGVIQVTGMIVLALAIALFLDSKYCRGRRIFSVIYFLPFAVPGVIAAIMWGFLFSPQLDSLLRIGHAGINPLASPAVLYAIMLIVTWEATGYNMTIYLTGLSSVTTEVLEAARIDGCSEWALAWRIKVPLLRRTLMFTIVLSIIGTLQLFNEPSIISSLTTLPAGYTPNLEIYDTAFTFGNITVAAAESVVLAVITVVASLSFFQLTRMRQRARDRGVSMRAVGPPVLGAASIHTREAVS